MIQTLRQKKGVEGGVQAPFILVAPPQQIRKIQCTTQKLHHSTHHESCIGMVYQRGIDDNRRTCQQAQGPLVCRRLCSLLFVHALPDQTVLQLAHEEDTIHKAGSNNESYYRETRTIPYLTGRGNEINVWTAHTELECNTEGARGEARRTKGEDKGWERERAKLVMLYAEYISSLN